MSEATSAPVPTIEELNDAHHALAAELRLIGDQLAPLIERRRQLALTATAAYKLAEATMARGDWGRSGEEAWRERVGLNAYTDAYGDVENLVSELDQAGELALDPGSWTPTFPAEAAEEGEETPALAGWIPKMPTDLGRFNLEFARTGIKNAAAGVRLGITSAAREGAQVFTYLREVYDSPSEGVEEVEEVESLLARALLIVTMSAEEAIERASHRLGQTEEQRAASR